ncbi:MAG: hypothetical protein ACM3N7_11585 [Planctomycetaceae bacterium]
MRAKKKGDTTETGEKQGGEEKARKPHPLPDRTGTFFEAGSIDIFTDPEKNSHQHGNGQQRKIRPVKCRLSQRPNSLLHLSWNSQEHSPHPKFVRSALQRGLNKEYHLAKFARIVPFLAYHRTPGRRVLISRGREESHER